jgi:hypothetical protein
MKASSDVQCEQALAVAQQEVELAAAAQAARPCGLDAACSMPVQSSLSRP